MNHLLLGGSGILGSALRMQLARQGRVVERLSPMWADADAVQALLAERLPAAASADGPLTVLWAAGVGHVGASAESLRAETAGLQALADAIRRLPGEQRERVTVLFASSAGALFAGHGDDVVEEDTPPSPTGPYGFTKLAQEQLLRELVDDAACRVVSCRISNLYGLADGHLPRRGLLPTAVRCTRLRQPMTVFVPSDTRRDYLFSRDAAAQQLSLLPEAPSGFSTRLVADGSTRSVVQVLSVVRQVSGRRVPVTFAERPETRLQPRVLRFRIPRTQRGRATPMEAAVHVMLRAPLAT